MAVRFEVPGAPVGKQRPRTVRVNGQTRTYTPDKTRLYEQLVVLCYRKDCWPRYFAHGIPLRVTIVAGYKIPQSVSAKVREKMLRGALIPTVKPDCDNVVKSICDALNGIAYEDDAQIAEVVCCKKYMAEPKVVVAIEEVRHE